MTGEEAPTELDRPTGGARAFEYEIVVSIFLIALIVLWRDNPLFVFPQFLFSLVLLLVVNLGTGVGMRLGLCRAWLSAGSIMLNCAAVTAALHYSGGADSKLWVLYLLPLFSGGLMLRGRELLWVLLGTLAFNGTFHALVAPDLGTDVWAEILLRSATLVIGTWAIWRLASRRRETDASLAKQRVRVSRLERRMQRLQRGQEAAKKAGSRSDPLRLFEHDLRTPIAVILGSAELLLDEEYPHQDMREDFERIRRSAIRARDLLARYAKRVKD